MDQELAHSFNVSLDPEVVGRIAAIQKELLEDISERRNYDSSAHLAIATKFMGQSETEAFAEALVSEFRDDPSWEISFSSFGPAATGNFVFLNLSDESRRRMLELHHRALDATRGVGSEEYRGMSPKYAYDPHISIIKLRPEEREKALALINNEGFLDVTMRVNSYEITRQEDDANGFSIFPKVRGIGLR